MPLDPQAQALLEQMKQMGFIYTPGLTAAKGREMVAQFLAIRPPGEPVGRVEDRLIPGPAAEIARNCRSEEHTSELQSRPHLVCRLLLEKKKRKTALKKPASRVP